MEKKRLHSLDATRGLTIAGMILVNNAGDWSYVFTPLRHVSWNGLSPADLVYPFFMFIMGVSMFFSLRGCEFKPRWGRVLRRAAVIIALGLGLGLLKNGGSFEHLRLPGVLQRLGVAYLLATAVVVWCERGLGWVVAGVLAAYFATLRIWGEGIVGAVDVAVFGSEHLYTRGFDPEGLLSTVPSVCNVLIGFLCGRIIGERDLMKLFAVGAAFAMAGFLLAYGCPINKNLWSPTFVLVTCGLGATLLATMEYWGADRLRRGSIASASAAGTGGVGQSWILRFFAVFGANSLFIYIFAEVLTMVTNQVRTSLFSGGYGSSLAWSVVFVMACWTVAWVLWRRKVFIRI